MQKKVISIDGGGIRGVVPAYILSVLEEKMQTRLYKKVDMFAGTSTGTILSAGLAQGKSASELLDLYFVEGPNIFSRTFGRKLKTGFGAFGGKYDVDNLIEILEKYYGKDLLETMKTDFLCTAYSLTEGQPKFFSKVGDGNLPVARVVASSAAAPTYFDPVNIQGSFYCDGGVFASNPSACAFAEVKDLYDLKAEDILLASFGTGNRQKCYSNMDKWFKFKWITPLIDIMMASDANVVDYQLYHIYNSVGASANYMRINGKVPENIAQDMADASEENLNNLLAFAKSLAKQYNRELDILAEKLVG